MWGETIRTLMQYRGWSTVWGVTTHTLMQYRGVVHCVRGDNTHTNGYTVKDVVGTLLKEPLYYDLH